MTAGKWVCLSPTDGTGRDGRARTWGLPVSFIPSLLKGEQKVHALLPPQVWLSYRGGHMVSDTLTTCPALRGIHTLLLRHKIKKKVIITNKINWGEPAGGWAAIRPGSCTCPSHRPLAPGTPSLSGCQCISVHERETKPNVRLENVHISIVPDYSSTTALIRPKPTIGVSPSSYFLMGE